MSKDEAAETAGDDAGKGPGAEDDGKQPKQESAAETKAREGGWKPESEWEGSDDDKPEEFFTAEMFNMRGHFIGEHKKQQKRMNDMEVNFNTRMTAANKLRDGQLKIQKEELEGKRDEAIALADVDGASKIQGQIDEINSMPAEEAPAAENLTQVALDEWNQANPWIFQTGPKSAYAHSQLSAYAGSGQDVATALANMERDIAREFPASNGTREKVPSSEGGSKPGGKRGSAKLSMSDLTSDEKKFRAAMPGAWKDDKEFLQAVQDIRSEES